MWITGESIWMGLVLNREGAIFWTDEKGPLVGANIRQKLALLPEFFSCIFMGICVYTLNVCSIIFFGRIRYEATKMKRSGCEYHQKNKQLRPD